MTTTSHWVTGLDGWAIFSERHPELGYRRGKWQFHNFLRVHRATLVGHDAIRVAKRRFWIAHVERF